MLVRTGGNLLSVQEGFFMNGRANLRATAWWFAFALTAVLAVEAACLSGLLHYGFRSTFEVLLLGTLNLYWQMVNGKNAPPKH